MKEYVSRGVTQSGSSTLIQSQFSEREPYCFLYFSRIKSRKSRSFAYFCKHNMETRKYAYWTLPVIITLVILYLCCLIPPKDVPEVKTFLFFPFDKFVHFVMYVTLSGTCSFSFIHLSKNSGHFGKFLAWCILYPILFGGLIEIIQYNFCPGRTGDWFDFLADSLGVLFVVPFAILYHRYIQKKHESKK